MASPLEQKQQKRRRPNLSVLPVPKRNFSLAVPLPLPPGPPPLNTTQIFKYFDIDRVARIGSGTGGTVYKVIHRPTGKPYALKVIYGNHDDAVRGNICREIQILRDVDNPNVVKCLESFNHNDEIQVLLEYMDRGSLEGAKMSDEHVLSDTARQILSGLYYLHKRKIVHRDIKPANLLVNSRRIVKIADFGVSRILAASMDPCNSSVGTIAYMSPERINTDLNNGMYDGYAGDVWSFGLSILEFYLGKFPLEVGLGDWPSLMNAICLSPPPQAPSYASTEFKDFIACCLNKDQTKRWTARQLLKHPFIVQYQSPVSASGNEKKQLLTPKPHLLPA